MTISKSEAIHILEDAHAAIDDLFSQLSDEDFSRRGTMGGGEWSAKDVAAHMGGWYERVLEGLDALKQGERPQFADLLAPEETVDRVNAEIVEEWLAVPAARARERYRMAHEHLIVAVRGLSENEWEAEVPPPAASPPERRSIGDLLGETLDAPGHPFGHAFAHVDDVGAYLEELAAGH